MIDRVTANRSRFTHELKGNALTPAQRAEAQSKLGQLEGTLRILNAHYTALQQGVWGLR